MPLIGVLALQGGYGLHAKILRDLGADVREVRTVADLEGLDGLVMPGGESTTMSLGIEREGLAGPLREFARERAVFGTCAGMIMLDRDHLGILDIRAERNAFGRQVRSFGKPILGTCAGMIMLDRDHLGILDIRAERNAFGRQIRSFETDLEIFGDPLHAVFIRAPWVAEAGKDVEVLAEVDGHPVAVRQGNVMAVAFHPELAGETRLHERFLASLDDESVPHRVLGDDAGLDEVQ